MGGPGRLRRPLRAGPRPLQGARAGLRHRRGGHQAQGGLRSRAPRHGRHRSRRHERQRRVRHRRRAAVLPRLLRDQPPAGRRGRPRWWPASPRAAARRAARCSAARPPSCRASTRRASTTWPASRWASSSAAEIIDGSRVAGGRQRPGPGLDRPALQRLLARPQGPARRRSRSDASAFRLRPSADEAVLLQTGARRHPSWSSAAERWGTCSSSPPASTPAPSPRCAPRPTCARWPTSPAVACPVTCRACCPRAPAPSSTRPPGPCRRSSTLSGAAASWTKRRCTGRSTWGSASARSSPRRRPPSPWPPSMASGRPPRRIGTIVAGNLPGAEADVAIEPGLPK